MVTGCTYYKGFRAAQHVDFTNVFQKFLDDMKFDIIIEIGTLNGGLTRFLVDASPKSKIYSYDIVEQPEHKQLAELGVNMRLTNIFDNSYRIIDNEILGVLRGDGKKLILCDGGNKIHEFNAFAPYLRRADFIMAHDYCRDLNFYKQEIYDKIWNWCEITEKDISGVSKACNLWTYNDAAFQKIVWVCKCKV